MLFTCGEHLHDHIISRRGVFWAHKTSVTPPLFIEVSVPSQESEHVVMYLYDRGINFASLCTIVLLDFGIVPIGWYCFLSLLPFYIDNPMQYFISM